MQDIVIYDGECSFCVFQINLLKGIDFRNKLRFVSLHDESIYKTYPMLNREKLLQEMGVVSSKGLVYSGAGAVKHLSKKLWVLWPLALLLHIPFTNDLWNMVYRFIAKNRYLIAGKCNGNCSIK